MLFLVALMLLAAVVVLVAAAIKYFGSDKPSAAAPPREDPNRALEVLDERYARGEIERQEYRRKRRDLTRHGRT